MNYVNLSFVKFGVIVPVFLIPIFIAKVLYYISQGDDAVTAIVKAIKDTLGIEV